jgi:DNA-packaging protein gp3
LHKLAKFKHILTPEQIAKLFVKYRKYVSDNPFKVHDYVGKEGNSVYREKQRPLTLNGFSLWLSDNGHLGINSLGHYLSNYKNAYDDYVDTLNAIKQRCATDVLEGALVGIYSSGISARHLGLAEKVQQENTNREILNIDPLGD